MATKRSSRSTKDTSSAAKADDVKAGSETKIFVIKKSLIPEDDKYLEIVNLTHPRTGSGAKFLIHEKQVYEIVSFQERYRSWFIGQSAVSNGNVYMTTSIDPLFLALPFLVAECSDRAVPIDQLFMDTEGLRNGRLLEVFNDEQLKLVADVKRSGDIKALKYNEEKVLSWLEAKCEKLVPKLMEHKIHCGTAATSANFVKSEKMDMENDSKGDKAHLYSLMVREGTNSHVSFQMMSCGMRTLLWPTMSLRIWARNCLRSWESN